MNSDSLKYVLRQFAERTLLASRPRKLVLPTGADKVVGLTGVRRSGKAFLFFDTIRRITEQGVDRRCIVYLNFEDDRLNPMRTENLGLVLRCLQKLYPGGNGTAEIFDLCCAFSPP